MTTSPDPIDQITCIGTFHRKLERTAQHMQRRFTSLRDNDDGMISFATVVGVLIIVVLVGFLGNVLRATQQKIEIQNSADAVAFSSAQWMARGMNAVTASNHLIGELTAICILHEAIGGPELDEDKTVSTTEMSAFNGTIQGLYNVVPSTTIPFDRNIVRWACKAICDEDEKPKGAAMLYDARMMLKWICTIGLGIKAIGLVLEAFQLTRPIAIPVHIAGTGLIFGAGKEYYVLRYLQKLTKVLVKPKQILEDKFIPLLTRYSETLAGDGFASAVGTPLPWSIQLTLDELQNRNRSTVLLAPRPLNLRLPIEKEPPPKKGSPGLPESNYSGSSWPAPLEKVLSLFDKINEILKYVTGVLKFIPGLSELARLATGPIGQFSEFLSLRPGADGSPQNPTRDRVSKLAGDWDDEKSTQWTRATYPYVDPVRAAIAGALSNITMAPLSKAPTYFIHWGNRFTVVKTYLFRKGQRMTAGRKAKPVTLYQMKESEKLSRGNEPWTSDSNVAEDLFTLVGFAHRPVSTPFSPVVYQNPGPSNYVTYAQSMYYNGNEQSPGEEGEYGDTQPVVGWNTLNWESPGSVPEWGSEATDAKGSLLPWDAIRNNWSGFPTVKLNWQAKLVPVTRRRLLQSLPTTLLDNTVRGPAAKAVLFTGALDGH